MTADIVMENAQNHSSKNEPAEGHDQDGKFDECELGGYITVHNRIAPEIVNALRSNDRTSDLDAATKLHRLVDKRGIAANQPIIDSGILFQIINMISLEDADLHVHLSTVLSSVVAGSSEHTLAAVENGAIQKFILLATSSSSNEARDDALRSLGNIGADPALVVEKLIRGGGVEPLLDVLDAFDPDDPSKNQGSHVLRAAQALKSITESLKSVIESLKSIDEEFEPGSDEYEMIGYIRATLTLYILYETNETAESLEASLLALKNILSTSSGIDSIASSILPRLVELCTAKHFPTRQAALGCVGLILAGSHKGIDRLVEAGIIEAIRPCITSEDGEERWSACWAAANIAIGIFDEDEALMAAGLAPPLIKVVLDPEEGSKARGHAALALANLAAEQGGRYHKILETLLEAGCLDAFLSALKLNNRKVVDESLNGITAFVHRQWDGKQGAIEMLKAGGGVAVLRALKLRPEPDLARERVGAHVILKYTLQESSLPPRV